MNNNFYDRKICPNCEKSQGKQLLSLPYEDAKIQDYLKSFYGKRGYIDIDVLKGSRYTLIECLSCKLIYQKEVLNDDYTKVLYEDWINPTLSIKRRSKENQIEYFINNSKEIQIISNLLTSNNYKKLKILDFGLGWGEWALMAKAYGHDVYGCELSTPRIEMAHKNAIKIIPFEKINGFDFDFINTEQVFEHLLYPKRTLIELRKGLNSSGVLKISVPYAHNIKKIISKSNWSSEPNSRYSINPIAPLEHINYYRNISLVKLGKSVGLEQLKIPLNIQYKYNTNWKSVRSIIKNITYPVYLNYFSTKNYMLFKKV